MAIPLLANCDIGGKDITADALLTQRALATYIVGQQAAYPFTVKSNQPTLERDIALLFESRQAPDFVEVTPPDHGRIEWSIESVHHIIDWNYDEDRSRIRTGFGPENITRLRRFAIGILKSFQKPSQSIAGRD